MPIPFLPLLLKADHKSLERTSSLQLPIIIKALEQGDWTALRTLLAPILKFLLSEDTWTRLQRMHRLSTGAIVSIGEPRIRSGWFPTVELPVVYVRSRQILVLRFTGGGAICGFKFKPETTGTTEAWQAPSYADPALFEEQVITLGSFGSRVHGILTLPNTTRKCACIILLSGSGPNDADGTTGPNKPLKDLAYGLASRDIATVRFDKITHALLHKLRIALFSKNTFTLSDEYIPHARAAVKFCLTHPRISDARIYVAGHSLGGYVAPRLVAETPRIAGCILLAAPARVMYHAALAQMEFFASLDGERADLAGIEELRAQIVRVEAGQITRSTPAAELPLGIAAAYWSDMRTFDPVEDCRALRRPVLCLQGGRDYQVTLQDEFELFRKGLDGEDRVQLEVLPELNHLLIAGEGACLPAEYEVLGHVAVEVVERIAGWVDAQSRGSES